MGPTVDIAAVARVLADRTRAAMCGMLMDGRFHTAGELAAGAGVSRATASGHLSRLMDEGFVSMRAQGRHRYYRLADSRYAQVIESLGAIAPPVPPGSLRQVRAAAALRAGRTCYDHLAGRLGVTVTDALVRAGVLDGNLGFVSLGPLGSIDVALPAASQPGASRPCVDWTERRYHVAGPLAAAMTARLFELDWIRHVGEGRAVRLTGAGEESLGRLLGVELAGVGHPEAS